MRCVAATSSEDRRTKARNDAARERISFSRNQMLTRLLCCVFFSVKHLADTRCDIDATGIEFGLMDWAKSAEKEAQKGEVNGGRRRRGGKKFLIKSQSVLGIFFNFLSFVHGKRNFHKETRRASPRKTLTLTFFSPLLLAESRWQS